MKTKKHLYIILNRVSGSGKAEEIEAVLTSLEGQYAFSAEIKDTEYSGHARLLARDYAEQSRYCPDQAILIAMGGDGTLSEVIQGLGEDYCDLPVAFVPYGSGNDFARSEELPLKPLNALIHLLEVENPTALDVLKYDDLLRSQTYFSVNSVGIGLDGAIVHEKNKKASNTKTRTQQFSKYAYLSALFTAYKFQTPFQVNLQTKEKEWQFDDAILQLNLNRPYFGGGINVVPQASSSDAVIDVLVLKKLDFLKLSSLVFQVLKGKGKHLTHPSVRYLQLPSYTVSFSSAEYGQADGEVLPLAPHSYRFSTFKQAFWV